MLGTIRLILTAASFTTVLANPLSSATALDRTPAGSCWQAYILCNEPAFGDETWRSACYADLTGCLRDVRPARCAPEAKAECASFKADCDAVLEEDNPSGPRQCEADHNACLLSFGC